MQESERYARQRILAEIGEAGQARLEGARLLLGRGLTPQARDAAERYGLGMGFAEVRETTDQAAPAFRHAAHFRHPAAAELARGAHLALQLARQLLQLDEATA